MVEGGRKARSELGEEAEGEGAERPGEPIGGRANGRASEQGSRRRRYAQGGDDAPGARTSTGLPGGRGRGCEGRRREGPRAGLGGFAGQRGRGDGGCQRARAARRSGQPCAPAEPQRPGSNALGVRKRGWEVLPGCVAVGREGGRREGEGSEGQGGWAARTCLGAERRGRAGRLIGESGVDSAIRQLRARESFSPPAQRRRSLCAAAQPPSVQAAAGGRPSLCSRAAAAQPCHPLTRCSSPLAAGARPLPRPRDASDLDPRLVRSGPRAPPLINTAPRLECLAGRPTTFTRPEARRRPHRLSSAPACAVKCLKPRRVGAGRVIRVRGPSRRVASSPSLSSSLSPAAPSRARGEGPSSSPPASPSAPPASTRLPPLAPVPASAPARSPHALTMPLHPVVACQLKGSVQASSASSLLLLLLLHLLRIDPASPSLPAGRASPLRPQGSSCPPVFPSLRPAPRLRRRRRRLPPSRPPSPPLAAPASSPCFLAG